MFSGLTLLPFMIFLCFSFTSHGEQSSVSLIESYLREVSQEATEYQIQGLQEKSDRRGFDLNLAAFQTRGSLGYQQQSSQDPLFSPFSPASTEKSSYSFGLDKRWMTGLSTSLAYNLEKASRSFPKIGDVSFISPDFSLTLETNLLRDLIQGRHRHLGKRVQLAKEQVGLQALLEKKQILIQALMDLGGMLETKEELELQTALCQEIKKQSKKLRQKYKKKSVSKIDFLLSQKNMNSCLASLENLEKNLMELKEKINLQYNIQKPFYAPFTMNQLFKDISSLYEKRLGQTDQADFQNRTELVVLKKGLEVNRWRMRELKAEASPDMNLSLSAGYKGFSPDNLTSAHTELYNSTYPYVLGQMQILFPFKNLENSVNKALNNYQKEILKKRLEQQAKQARSRFQTLLNNLKKNFSIYNQYEKNIDLSKEIIKEARKKFRNGRIDFVSLSDFQKALIESQRQMSILRSQIISDAIEYLDYFHFFDRYY